MKTLFAIAAVAALVHPANARACFCADYPAPLRELAESTAVFSGSVTEIQPLPSDEGMLRNQVTFAVTRIWKGARTRHSQVVTAMHEASCGFPFQIGKSYLVYAWSDRSGRARTSLCQRTQGLQSADEDLRDLGPGLTPFN